MTFSELLQYSVCFYKLKYFVQTLNSVIYSTSFLTLKARFRIVEDYISEFSEGYISEAYRGTSIMMQTLLKIKLLYLILITTYKYFYPNLFMISKFRKKSIL